MSLTVQSPEVPAAALVAAHLRRAVGDLVRATRSTVDALAPIPAAVMDLLDRGGPMTTADLATRREVRHQTMAVIVKELLDLGYVDAVPHEVDRRKKVLRLTLDGKRALDADREGRVKRMSDAVERSLAEEEVQLLDAALGLIDRVTATIAEDLAPGDRRRGPITGDW
jgi:DNA-binding MarR family transcriptional regulator